MRKWIFIVAAVGVFYLTASTLAHRNYWAGLFWSEYLVGLPAYDIIDGPRQSIQNRLQYRAAIKFIEPRLLSPSTASFCPFSGSQFGSVGKSNQRAMVGCVDAQNTFGAMIRTSKHYLS